MTPDEKRRWPREALGAGFLFIAYFATARLGLLMDAVAGFATLVWPPTGIALSALLLFGTRLWPGILAGRLCVNLVPAASFRAASGLAAGTRLDALAGPWQLRR